MIKCSSHTTEVDAMYANWDKINLYHLLIS